MEDDRGWIQVQKTGSQVRVDFSTYGLPIGSHQGTITLQAESTGDILAAIPVSVRVVEQIFPVYLTAAAKSPLLPFLLER